MSSAFCLVAVLSDLAQRLLAREGASLNNFRSSQATMYAAGIYRRSDEI